MGSSFHGGTSLRSPRPQCKSPHLSALLCPRLGWGWRGGLWDACEAPDREPGPWEHWARGVSPRPEPPLTSHLTPLCSLLSRCPGQVLSESDLDNDNMLSFSEFEHAMAKAPDFMK